MLPAPEQAKKQVESLAVPQKSIGVEAFSDNNGLTVLGPLAFPEVAALLPLGVAGAEPVLAALADPKLDGTPEGDRLRALMAFVLEQWNATTAVPALRAYGARVIATPDRAFFSLQTTAHAIAVLSGQAGRVRSLYNVAEVQSILAGTAARIAGTAARIAGTAARIIPTTMGTAIDHEHLIGPAIPFAWWQTDYTPAEVAQKQEFFEKKMDGLAKFEDPITILEPATRSYDCHSFTFRRGDTQLADLNERYHILGEAVPVILKDEGYIDVTTSPATWRPGDVVVFYKTAGGVPTHTGRLSFGGTGLEDPQLRFTSKWSVYHPVINVSVRDCMKLYGRVVKIYSKVQECAAEVKAGGQNTCARRIDGAVYCWGDNGSGQLGDGTAKPESATPVKVVGLEGTIALSVGMSSSCAVKKDGTVWCWGNNESGVLGDGTKESRNSPVQVAGLTGVAQVAMTIGMACARKDDASVWCWGGSLGAAPVRMVAAGPPPNDPPAPLEADDIVGGFGGVSAHTPDGRLFGWDGARGSFPGNRGSNWRIGLETAPANGAYPVVAKESVSTEPPTLLTGASRAAVLGRLHACALLASGVTCWGTNIHGQLGREPVQAAYQYPGMVAGLGPVIDIAGGAERTCVRTSDGKIWCWGAGSKPSQFERSDSTVPIEITGVPPLTGAGTLSLTAGDDHACARAPDGIWCWGSNLFGQIGTGATAPTNVLTPARSALPCP